jgi:uncharacterized phage-associated protein
MAIEFKLNKIKAVEAVLWFIKKKNINDLYSILKMVFESDKYHLNKYERPVTGDSYMAMEFGTVPKWLYNEACGNPNIDFVRSGNHLYAKRNPITSMFSESDIEALEIGYKKYKNLDFNGVKAINHREPAWKKHEKKLKFSTSINIPFEDIVEDPILREDLKETARLTVI